MFRLFKMLWYKMTGKTDRIIDMMSQDPDIAAARFNAAKGKKTKNTLVLREAVASLTVQAGKKKIRIDKLRKQIGDIQQEANGALALAKKAATGLTKDEADANVEYQSHRAAYASKMASINTLKGELEGPDGKGGLVAESVKLEKEIAGHMAQLQNMARALGQIDQERDATIAAITAAKEREGIADILSGISQDSGEKELEEMRSVRDRAVARSEVAVAMAGTQTTSSDAMYREAGAMATGGDDFDALMNFKEDPAKAPSEPVKLPEN